MARRSKATGWESSWRRALQRAGLEVDISRGVYVTARDDSAKATARFGTMEAGRRMFAFSATHSSMHRGLLIRPETRFGRWSQSVLGPDILTHDEAFDQAACVIGDAPWIVAALTPPVRAALLPYVEADWVVQQQRIGGWLAIDSSGQLAAHLRALLRLARRLAMHPDEIPTRLMRLTDRSHPKALRLDALRLLSTHVVRTSADVPRALRSALEGDDDEREAAQGLVTAWLNAHPDRASGQSEGLLLRVLPGLDRPARLAAVERLGEVGRAQAVSPLQALVRGFLVRAALKTAVRLAIARIQKRGGPPSGALSLSKDARAGLSLFGQD